MFEILVLDHENLSDFYVEVLDMMGQEILVQPLARNLRVSLEGYSSGVYYVVLKSEEGGVVVGAERVVLKN